MSYAYKFEGFDREERAGSADYSSKINRIDVTVMADNEDEALAKARASVTTTRAFWVLEDIVELSDTLRPVSMNAY